MFEKLEFCPICESKDFTNHLIVKDHSVSGETFALVKCQSCSFLFTNPRPSADQLGKYYKSDQYISHTNSANSPINLIYKLARKFTLRSKVSLIDKFRTNGSVLDVGCGTGNFLSECIKAGWQVQGIEPDDGARNIAKELIHSDPKLNFEELDKTDFNIITLWHVLEHVPDINYYFEQIKKHLHKKGTIIVAVPNHESWDAKHYKENWAAYDVPRHLYHFDQKTMKKLAKKHKCKIVQTLPMKLDSYYVSLLSETYHNTGFKKYLNFLLNGYKSNSYALKNDNNFSSLIYIIQKQ